MFKCDEAAFLYSQQNTKHLLEIVVVLVSCDVQRSKRKNIKVLKQNNRIE